MARRQRRATETVWAVNCLLALGALGTFYRTVVAAEDLVWPENPPAPAQVVEESTGTCNAIWEAELFKEPPPPPPPPERPQFACDGLIGRRVSLLMNGEALDPLRVGDHLPTRIDGCAVRVDRIEKNDVILVIEGTVEEEIRVPRGTFGVSLEGDLKVPANDYGLGEAR